MSFMLVQLVLCLLFFVLLSGFFASNKVRALIAGLAAVFQATEVASVLIGNSLVDYKFYAHLNFQVVRDVGTFFLKDALLIALAFLSTFFLVYFLGRLIYSRIRKYRFLSLLGALLCLGGMLLPGGIVHKLAEISRMHAAKEVAIEDSLKSLGFERYTPKTAVKATPGKNIIAIFMESVEEGFVLDNMATLTPNLQRMKREMRYHSMKQNAGCDFTIGAIYAYFTGFPMYFKHHGNDIFEKVIGLDMPSVGTALHKAGYHQEYIAGHPEFAGTDIMMNLMKVKVKSEKDFAPQYTMEPWGLHDRDLFEIVDEELERLYEKEQPFAYFISTISTHAPDGVFDWRMAKELPAQKSQLELMVASLDKHIGKLVTSLEEKGRLENTALFILPDHLLMGNGARVLKDFASPRELFVITNTPSPRYGSSESIMQIDMPNLLLDGAGVKHNITFLTDVITEDKQRFLQDHKREILQLNEAALARQNNPNEVQVSEDKTITLNAKTIHLISNGWIPENKGQESYIFLGKKQLKPERGVNLLSYERGKYKHRVYDTFDNAPVAAELLNKLEELVQERAYFLLLVHGTAGKILQTRQVELQKLGLPKLGRLAHHQAYMAFSNQGFTSEEVRRKRVDDQFPLRPRKPLRPIGQILQDAQDRQKFIAHAGGMIDGYDYTNCREALDLSYEKGFRLFELDIIKTTDGHYVASHDWHQWRDKTGYAGAVPVDLATFMAHKIYKQYTPLDMAAINAWFQAHPDAILVTDKVNAPGEFVPQFVDRERLMMELFSFDAITEAQGLGIKDVILTEGIWDYLGGDKLKGMQERKLQSMAISIHTINNNRSLFSKLKKAGIRVYAFHVANKTLRDEAYMVREGLDYCFGFYADQWRFE